MLADDLRDQPAARSSATPQDEHPQTYQANVGRAFYYEKKFGKDLHGAYIFSADLKAAENSNRASMTQMQEAGSGIKQDFEALISVAGAADGVHADRAETEGQQRRTTRRAVRRSSTTVLLRKEAKLQGITDPEFIWDCTLQCYDKDLIAQGGADVEGQYVSLLFLPFEEAGTNKTLAQFLKYTGKDKADGFGIQAYASGLLVGAGDRANRRQGRA